MENDRIAKRVYIGECGGCRRGVLILKDYLKKEGLDVRQARRMVHDRSVWWGVCEGNA